MSLSLFFLSKLSNIFISGHCLCMFLSFFICIVFVFFFFFWSWHVFASLWSIVRKVTCLCDSVAVLWELWTQNDWLTSHIELSWTVKIEGNHQEQVDFRFYAKRHWRKIFLATPYALKGMGDTQLFIRSFGAFCIFHFSHVKKITSSSNDEKP